MLCSCLLRISLRIHRIEQRPCLGLGVRAPPKTVGRCSIQPAFDALSGNRVMRWPVTRAPQGFSENRSSARLVSPVGSFTASGLVLAVR